MNYAIYTYSLPLIGGGVREGIVYRLIFPNGQERWTEASALLGRSTETLSEALSQMQTLFSSGSFRGELAPSVQFSLDCPITFPATGSVCAFLKGDENEILERAITYSKLGFTHAKVKISSLAPDSARFVLNFLKELFRLRVDCNAAFSFEQAVNLFSSYSPSDFDYIEDPTYERDRLTDFPLPFALDENLPTSFPPHLHTLVIKPTIRGGRTGCIPLLQLAQAHNLGVYFSSAMESGIGLLQILSLASSLGHTQPLGICTSHLFEEDLIDFDFQKPQLELNEMPSIRMHLLKEVASGKYPLPDLSK
ncbi:MAG: hypothetical protein HYX67_08425 [Candidatus Melainabacteria bacterium]|nr:hypothetical protein [Candidatus Melainabacteria bacterium]